MTKCKDCIHEKVCVKWAENYVYRTRNRVIFNGCEHFTDANKTITLPCRIGDTVWYYNHSFVIENIFICANRVIYRCGNAGTEDYMPFDNNDIGKTVFLTREDAEKALKECDHNDL